MLKPCFFYFSSNLAPLNPLIIQSKRKFGCNWQLRNGSVEMEGRERNGRIDIGETWAFRLNRGIRNSYPPFLTPLS